MSRQSLVDLIRQLPHASVPYRDSDQMDAPVELYSGPVQVEHDGIKEQCSGHIVFRWLPTPSLRFEVETTVDPGVSVIVRIPGQGFETSGFVSWATRAGSAGILNGNSRLGSAEDVDEVRFQLANFHDFVGDPVRYGPDAQPRMRRGRITLPSRNWVVTIDQVEDYESRKKVLKNRAATQSATQGRSGRLMADKSLVPKRTRF
jgi:hypothetical protein